MTVSCGGLAVINLGAYGEGHSTENDLVSLRGMPLPTVSLRISICQVSDRCSPCGQLSQCRGPGSLKSFAICRSQLSQCNVIYRQAILNLCLIKLPIQNHLKLVTVAHWEQRHTIADYSHGIVE